MVGLKTVVTGSKARDSDIYLRGTRSDVTVVITSDNKRITEHPCTVITTIIALLIPFCLDVANLFVIVGRVHRVRALCGFDLNGNTIIQSLFTRHTFGNNPSVVSFQMVPLATATIEVNTLCCSTNNAQQTE